MKGLGLAVILFIQQCSMYRGKELGGRGGAAGETAYLNPPQT